MAADSNQNAPNVDEIFKKCCDFEDKNLNDCTLFVHYFRGAQMALAQFVNSVYHNKSTIQGFQNVCDAYLRARLAAHKKGRPKTHIYGQNAGLVASFLALNNCAVSAFCSHKSAFNFVAQCANGPFCAYVAAVEHWIEQQNADQNTETQTATQTEIADLTTEHPAG